MRHDDEVLQAIESEVNLAEYISDQIELKPKGEDLFGNCSLHIDKTPSFSVTPKKNKYYCFSCGRGGGIISYLMEYEKYSYDSAVNKAIILSNVDINSFCQSESVKIFKQMNGRKKGSEPPARKILPASELSKYSKEPIEEWLDEGIRQEELSLFDVRIDHRSNNIVYPVYDLGEKLINIKARTRFKDYKKLGIQKYMNYYSIGVMDYFQGLNITYPKIKETGEVKIFESIKSVMKLMKYGISDAVSAEKHTLTDEQIRLLIRLQVNIVFCYDSDVSYEERKVRDNMKILSKYTNVYVVEDPRGLLGGKEGKNSPIDLGIKVWDQLYENRRKVVY